MTSETTSDLTYEVSWDKQKGGLKVVCTANRDIAKGIEVGVYFSSGTAYKNIVSGALSRFTVPAGTKPGEKKYSKQVPGSYLFNAPHGTTHVIVASNEADVQAIQDVQVVFGKDAIADVVSQRTIDVVKNCLRAAGQSSATITSTLRRPEDQARAMFNNLVNPKRTLQQNIQSQLALYGPVGDQVIYLFVQNVLVLADQTAIRPQVLADQTAIWPQVLADQTAIWPRLLVNPTACVWPQVLADDIAIRPQVLADQTAIRPRLLVNPTACVWPQVLADDIAIRLLVLANQTAIQQAMTDLIVQLARKGQRVSKHCVTREQYADQNIVDVGRSAFSATNLKLFIAAAQRAGVTVIDEPNNNCIHLEVNQR
jgi:hypothetical protein